jgi:SlyX protein
MNLDERVIDLQIRYTHQQDTIQQLSDMVAQQGRALEALRAEVEVLKRQLDGSKQTPPADERPPHY